MSDGLLIKKKIPKTYVWKKTYSIRKVGVGVSGRTPKKKGKYRSIFHVPLPPALHIS